MQSNNNWHMEKAPKPFLEVVADATINNINTAQGKTIPLVILDTISYPEVDRIIELHRDIPSGNVITNWGKSKDENYLSLSVELLDPSPIAFTIIFSAYPQAGIVDIIVSSQMLYIQCGKPGDRLKYDLDKPKLLIEVPSEKFSAEWKELYLGIIVKRFRKMDYSKKTAKKLALDFCNEMRIVKEMRIKK